MHTSTDYWNVESKYLYIQRQSSQQSSIMPPHSTIVPTSSTSNNVPTTFQLLRTRRSLREHLTSLQYNVEVFNSVLTRLRLRLLARASNPYKNGTLDFATTNPKKGTRAPTNILSTMVKEALEYEVELRRLRELLMVIELEAGDVMIRRDEMSKTVFDIQKERDESEEPEETKDEVIQKEQEGVGDGISRVDTSIDRGRGRSPVRGMRKNANSKFSLASRSAPSSLPTSSTPILPSKPISLSPVAASLADSDSDSSSSSSDSDSDGSLTLQRQSNHKVPRRNPTSSTMNSVNSAIAKSIPKPKWIPKRIWDSDLEVDIYIHRQQVSMLQMQLLEVEEIWKKLVGRYADGKMSDLRI